MKFEDIIPFVDSQIECLEEKLIPAASRVKFTSGGPLEDVWCETKEKAAELWCYEFSKYVKAHPGQLMWGYQPEMINKRFQSRSETAFMDNKVMYLVHAEFAIKAKNVAA